VTPPVGRSRVRKTDAYWDRCRIGGRRTTIRAWQLTLPCVSETRSVRQLYDSACELLFAAQQVRAAAGERGSAPAIAATVGCIDAALDALSEAIRAISHTAVTELGAAAGDEGGPVAAIVRIPIV
jgi:hypothetical protein